MHICYVPKWKPQKPNNQLPTNLVLGWISIKKMDDFFHFDKGFDFVLALPILGL